MTRPMDRLRDLDPRFADKVQEMDSCLMWTGAVDTHGYGNVGREGKTLRTHRLAYELLVGPIPAGLVLDHLCRNPLCCNPDHLEPVTQAVNVRRADTGIAVINAAKLFCPQGHPYDEENTYVWKGARRCRICNREIARRLRDKNPPVPPKTHCKRGHAFTEENTYVTRDGRRQCRTCHRNAARERMRARRARLRKEGAPS